LQIDAKQGSVGQIDGGKRVAVSEWASMLADSGWALKALKIFLPPASGHTA